MAGRGRGHRGVSRLLTSCAVPSMEPLAAAARELLLVALEDLSQEQLKRFCHKLRDAPLDGRSIPRGRLEGSDAVDLAEQLIHFYGPELALEVARKTLKRADVRDVAAQLKEQQLQSKHRVGESLGSLPLDSLAPEQSPGHRPPFFLPSSASPRKAPARPPAFVHKLWALGLRSCGWPRTADCALPTPHKRRGLITVLPFRARPQILGAALRVR